MRCYNWFICSSANVGSRVDLNHPHSCSLNDQINHTHPENPWGVMTKCSVPADGLLSKQQEDLQWEKCRLAMGTKTVWKYGGIQTSSLFLTQVMRKKMWSMEALCFHGTRLGGCALLPSPFASAASKRTDWLWEAQIEGLLMYNGWWRPCTWKGTYSRYPWLNLERSSVMHRKMKDKLNWREMRQVTFIQYTTEVQPCAISLKCQMIQNYITLQ